MSEHPVPPQVYSDACTDWGSGGVYEVNRPEVILQG